MRTTSMISILALICFGGAVHSQTSKEIIEKAITAHGGAEAINKYPAAKMTGKGKITIMGLEVAMESETLFQSPDMLKNTLDLDIGGNKVKAVSIYNAGKVRVTAAGMAVPVSDAAKDEVKETLYHEKLTRLTPLLDDKSLDISVIDKPDNVMNKEVNGLLIKSKGHKEVKLFFDKKAHMLVKMECTGLNEAEKEVKQETFYQDFKKFDGILTPTKIEMLMESKPFMKAEVVEMKYLDKIDKKEFDISD